MSEKETVLEVMRKAGEPLKPTTIITLTYFIIRR